MISEYTELDRKLHGYGVNDMSLFGLYYFERLEFTGRNANANANATALSLVREGTGVVERPYNLAKY